MSNRVFGLLHSVIRSNGLGFGLCRSDDLRRVLRGQGGIYGMLVCFGSPGFIVLTEFVFPKVYRDHTPPGQERCTAGAACFRCVSSRPLSPSPVARPFSCLTRAAIACAATSIWCAPLVLPPASAVPSCAPLPACRAFAAREPCWRRRAQALLATVKRRKREQSGASGTRLV